MTNVNVRIKLTLKLLFYKKQKNGDPDLQAEKDLRDLSSPHKLVKEFISN